MSKRISNMNEESSISGLNKLHSDGELSPTNTDPNVHDLEAQLQMWTNLQFNSVQEEQFFAPERDTASKSRHKALNPHLSELSFFGNVGAALSQQDSTASAAYERAKQQQAAAAAATHAHSINDLLAWGIYPSNSAEQLFTAPTVSGGVDNQILDPMLQNFGHEGRFGSLTGPSLPPLTLRGADSKGKQQQQDRLSHTAPVATTIDPATTTLNPPPSKRAKIRRPPGGFGIAGDHNLDHHLEEDVEMSIGDEQMDGKTDLSPSEDKRRRNTLASARFRLKKKEREVAMEKRAKELDERVADLERECESLRKENQWLKSLVVGATTGEDSAPPSQITSPANGIVGESAGSAIGAALGGQGNVINIDELVRVLKSKGAVITSSTGASTSAPGHSSSTSTASTALAPATGKRKRGAANAI